VAAARRRSCGRAGRCGSTIAVVPDARQPTVPLAGVCSCFHLARGHERGKCSEEPVVIERILGLPSALCAACAERWGFYVDRKESA